MHRAPSAGHTQVQEFIIEIPEQVRPIGIICVGYPDEKPERIERIPLSELVYYNKYGDTSGKM